MVGSFRNAYAWGAGCCAALMGMALYAQYGWHLEPCPLCIFQRVAICAMGLGFTLGALHGPTRRAAQVAYALAISSAGVWGIATAGRHLWLQHLPPDQVPACGPGLGYLFDAFPFVKMLKLAFAGSGECAKIEPFLGLPLPAWVLIWVVALTAWAWWAVRNGQRRSTESTGPWP